MTVFLSEKEIPRQGFVNIMLSRLHWLMKLIQ